LAKLGLNNHQNLMETLKDKWENFLTRFRELDGV